MDVRSEDSPAGAAGDTLVSPLVIVGATEAAIHVLERIPEDILKRTFVLAGESGESEIAAEGLWFARWKSKLKRLNLHAQVSRSTTRMHCPCPDSTKLERWATSRQMKAIGNNSGSHDRELLVNAVDGFVACPTLEAVDMFLTSRSKRLLKRGVKLVKDKVKSIEVLSEADTKTLLSKFNTGLTTAKIVRLTLISGASLLAQHVVLADQGTCIGRANVPAFLGRVSMASEALSTEKNTSAAEVANALEERMFIAEDNLDLSKLEVAQKRVCIVGGGMTSIHLAEQAVGKGAEQVYLVCKGKLDNKRDFEVEAGWMGGKYMRKFVKLKPEERLEIYKENRGDSTLSNKAKGVLDCLEQKSSFKLLSETYVASVGWFEGHWKLDLTRKKCAQCLSCDYIWVAAGTSFDCISEPIIQDLQNISRATIVGAYPLLNSTSLSWPGISNVLCMGALAALSLGPSAKYCHGFRTAAEKISKAILSPSNYVAPDTDVDVLRQQVCTHSKYLLCEGEGPSCKHYDSSNKPSLQSMSAIQQRLKMSTLQSPKSKCQIETYNWSDSEFEIDIYIKLDTSVEKENVTVIIGIQNLEVLAETSSKLYHLNIGKLYKPVQTEKSLYKVFSKKGKIMIRLRKTDNHDWKFLRG